MPGKGMDRLKTYIDALRVLARTNDPNRVVLIERNIDRYLKIESGGKERGLERLRKLTPRMLRKRPHSLTGPGALSRVLGN